MTFNTCLVGSPCFDLEKIRIFFFFFFFFLLKPAAYEYLRRNNLTKQKNMKLEHIGIAVKNLETSNDLFASLFGKKHYKIEEVASEFVKTSFFKTGSAKIELLEASNHS